VAAKFLYVTLGYRANEEFDHLELVVC